jgi:hypothetical protein
MKTRFALIISHRQGLNVNVYATDKDAKAALADYVGNWWETEMSKFNVRRPEHVEQMVNLYFYRIKDERFEIREFEDAA